MGAGVLNAFEGVHNLDFDVFKTVHNFYFDVLEGIHNLDLAARVFESIYDADICVLETIHNFDPNILEGVHNLDLAVQVKGFSILGDGAIVLVYFDLVGPRPEGQGGTEQYSQESLHPAGQGLSCESEKCWVVGVEALQDVHHERLTNHLRAVLDVVLGEIGVQRFVFAVVEEDGDAMCARHLPFEFLGGRMLQGIGFLSHSHRDIRKTQPSSRPCRIGCGRPERCIVCQKQFLSV